MACCVNIAVHQVFIDKSSLGMMGGYWRRVDKLGIVQLMSFWFPVLDFLFGGSLSIAPLWLKGH
jgi:hypothetical protein